MASTRVAGSFWLVYLVLDTTAISLSSQDEQIACFANAAAHLQAGGSFVIEVGVPELRRLPPGERYVVFHADGESWGIDEYDAASQALLSHHFREPSDQVVLQRDRLPLRRR